MYIDPLNLDFASQFLQQPMDRLIHKSKNMAVVQCAVSYFSVAQLNHQFAVSLKVQDDI